MAIGVLIGFTVGVIVGYILVAIFCAPRWEKRWLLRYRLEHDDRGPWLNLDMNAENIKWQRKNPSQSVS